MLAIFMDRIPITDNITIIYIGLEATKAGFKMVHFANKIITGLECQIFS